MREQKGIRNTGRPVSYKKRKEKEMEKTVKIGNRKVRLKANAMLPLLYREYFGEEIFKVQMSIFGLVNEKMEINLERGSTPSGS